MKDEEKVEEAVGREAYGKGGVFGGNVETFDDVVLVDDGEAVRVVAGDNASHAAYGCRLGCWNSHVCSSDGCREEISERCEDDEGDENRFRYRAALFYSLNQLCRFEQSSNLWLPKHPART